MWSTSVGAEVMKPLATPVLGGMLSSLIHVLIVTPVMFFAIRERQLDLQDQPLAAAAGRSVGARGLLIAAVILVTLVAGSRAAWRWTRKVPTNEGPGAAGGAVIQTVRSVGMTIVLRAPTGTLRTGRSTFTIEFRSSSGALLDVGTVHVAANMAMPGMVMPGNVQVQPAGEPGRYTATAEFGMAGAWPITIDWNGPAGRGSVNLEGSVQ
jgi:Cu(I)/Ag(I) efflux system membrane protein CusA/SilA